MVAIVLSAAAAPAEAAASYRLDLPAGSLGTAIVALGTQAGVNIGISDPGLSVVNVRAVHGTIGIATALRRMLAGTGATFTVVDQKTYRISRSATPMRPKAGPSTPLQRPTVDRAEIVVTASKRITALDRYPGSVDVLDVATLSRASLARGSAAIVRRVPTLASTNLGPGRNKLFIRGIADSSFNGPTQATVGQYLGDTRLNYSAPDPDLALYDIASIEVLEGPQGTLYGAGSLGGVIRLVPVPPDLNRVAETLIAGESTTAHGTLGSDVAATVNVPIASAVLGFRGVAYRSVEGGYIDDPLRGASNINRTRTEGGRAMLRAQPGLWTIDAGLTVQNINSRDGQYAERDLPPLQQSSRFAQPFDNDYLMGNVTVAHDSGDLHFLSTAGLVHHDVTVAYDASRSAALPRLFTQENEISLLSNENRISLANPDGSGWLLGTSFFRNIERLTRTLGPPDARSRITGVRNATSDVALYGEYTLRVKDRWFVTGGGRMAYAHLSGEALDRPGDATEPTRREVTALPSLAVLWKPHDTLTLFARYQEGFRPGGLSVADGNVERFKGDNIATIEVGARLGTPGVSRFDASAAVSHAHWENIQADLIDINGLPITANLGTGNVLGLEAQAAWRPLKSLAINASFFANNGKLDVSETGGSSDDSLPNIPELGAQAGVDYTADLGKGRTIALSALARYVGESRLAVGPLLNLPQGKYVDTAAGTRVAIGRIGLSIDVTNVLDSRGNRFSYGNPFTVAAGQQITPLQPRTLRIGLDAAF